MFAIITKVIEDRVLEFYGQNILTQTSSSVDSQTPDAAQLELAAVLGEDQLEKVSIVSKDDCCIIVTFNIVIFRRITMLSMNSALYEYQSIESIEAPLSIQRKKTFDLIIQRLLIMIEQLIALSQAAQSSWSGLECITLKIFPGYLSTNLPTSL